MTSLKNDTFLRSLLKQPVEYTPIWMMRQAGRYLPEYKATHAKAGSFLDLCKNTELATEVKNETKIFGFRRQGKNLPIMEQNR